MKNKFDDEKLSQNPFDDNEPGGWFPIAQMAIGVAGIIIVAVILVVLVGKFFKGKSSIVPVHEHVYASEYTVDIEPTCNKNGSKSRHCTFEGCEHRIDTTTVLMTGHQFDDGKITVKPTCIKEGIETFTCKYCGATKEETIRQIAHDWILDKTVSEASCTTDGKAIYKCKVCGETKEEITPKKAHNLGISVFADYNNDSVRYYRVCEDCGSMVFTNANGDITGGEITKNSDMSSKLANCERGAHDWAELTDRREPTCTREGKVTYECKVCGIRQTETIPVLEHVYEEITTPSTCTTTGTYIKKCKNCGLIVENKFLEMKNHNFGEPVVVTPYDCITNGWAKFTCKDCGYETLEKVYADGKHVFNNYTRVEGNQIIVEEKCERCGFVRSSSVEEIIPDTPSSVPSEPNEEPVNETESSNEG